MAMRIIDLTQTFTDVMPNYPGDPKPSLRQSAKIEKEGYEDHWLETGMHVGTHIDAPAHMIEGGKKIHELPLEMFSGRGIAVDARKRDLNASILKECRASEGDIVLFCTGLSKKYHTPEYFTHFPAMAEELARALVKRKMKMVGFDTPSPDRSPFAIHKILLGAGILIIENLTNLGTLLKQENFDIHAFPMSICADAAPARIMALIK